MASKKPMSNNNYFIILLLVTLLVIGGGGLAAKSLVDSILLNTKVVTAKDKANKQLDADVTAAPQLVQAYANLGSSKQLVADALPNTSDFPAFIGMMENLSTSVGVNLKSVSPSQVGAAATAGTTGGTGTSAANGSSLTPAPQSYDLTLSLEGNYGNLQKLLKAIEQSARPMRVTAVQLSGSGSNLAMQLDVTTFYQDKATLPIKMETVK